MEFKEKLISSHLAFEEDLDLNDSVHKLELLRLKFLKKKGFHLKKKRHGNILLWRL